MHAEDALDEALAHYQGTAPYWDWDAEVRHLVNHGPMASEALVALGRADALPALRTAYHPEKLRPLGRSRFASEVEALWDEVSADPLAAVRARVPSLLDGVMGASLHGLIRTGHAVRAWRRRPGAVRAREVAHGLALWSVAAQPLPGEPGARPQRPLLEGLDGVPRLPEARQVRGLISDRVVPMASLPGFVDAVERLDLSGDVGSHLSALTDRAARQMLVEGASRFAYLHVLTASVALRELLPVLGPDHHHEALGALVRAAMAVHGAYRTAEPGPEPALRSLEGLADAAVATGNDHTIKLAEAVLREETLGTSAARRAAAWAVVSS